MINSKCKASPEQIHAALDSGLDSAQAKKLGFIRQHLNSINDWNSALKTLIFELAAKYQFPIDLLMTVPGIGTPLNASVSLRKSALICPCSKRLSNFALGLG